MAYSNAFVKLLFDSYRDFAVPITYGGLKEEGNMSLREMILTTFDITGNMNDICLVKDVEQALKQFQKGKIAVELASLRVVKKKHTQTGEYRLKMCFYGMKQKNPETDPEC
jgi:hypothetical protein